MQKNQGVTRHHSKLLASAAALRDPCTAGSAAAWNPNTLSARMPTIGAEHAARHMSSMRQRWRFRHGLGGSECNSVGIQQMLASVGGWC